MWPNTQGGYFHATHPRNVAGIRSQGFRTNQSWAQAWENNPWGPGVYAADSPIAAAGTGRGAAILRVQPVGRNLNVCGQRFTQAQRMAIVRAARRNGFGSLTADPGPVTVILNPAHAIPGHLVSPVLNPSLTQPAILILPGAYPE